ncbi:MAG: hypothetical protein NVS3B20_19210 [Polyangiales bacterium]
MLIFHESTYATEGAAKGSIKSFVVAAKGKFFGGVIGGILPLGGMLVPSRIFFAYQCA